MPADILQFVQILYRRNRCNISVAGGRFAGFGMTAGIRQGCPLSPLLFALAADLLLRRLRRLLPKALIRAYADDLALVLPDGLGSAPLLENVFEEYAALSGLVLHHGKSVWLPLYHAEEGSIRAALAQAAPLWGGTSA